MKRRGNYKIFQFEFYFNRYVRALKNAESGVRLGEKVLNQESETWELESLLTRTQRASLNRLLCVIGLDVSICEKMGHEKSSLWYALIFSIMGTVVFRAFP